MTTRSIPSAMSLLSAIVGFVPAKTFREEARQLYLDMQSGAPEQANQFAGKCAAAYSIDPRVSPVGSALDDYAHAVPTAEADQEPAQPFGVALAGPVPVCPECGSSESLYFNMEAKWDPVALRFVIDTTFNDNGVECECTNCDAGFDREEANLPDPMAQLHGVLDRAERFITGFEDDHEQVGVVELLGDLRAALGREG